MRTPSLTDRLRRLGLASLVPGALPVEATNQAQELLEPPMPTRPTPGSAPRTVAVPPEGTVFPSTPPAPIRTQEDADRRLRMRPRPLPERFGEVLPGVLATGLGTTLKSGIDQTLAMAIPQRLGPTPGSQTQVFSLPEPAAAPPPSTPLPIASPEIIELVRAVHRGEITFEQAEEFAAQANRGGTLDKSGVSALLRAAQERRSQNG